VPAKASIERAASIGRAVSIGRAAAASSESPTRNTRMASRKAEVVEKENQKRRKT